jgi:hypothetical protein
MRTRRAPATRRRLSAGIEPLEERLAPAVTWSVAFNDPGTAYAAYYAPIQSVLVAAGNDWSRYFPSSSASIQLGVDFTTSPDFPRTAGSSEASSFVGKDGAFDVFEQSVAREIRTGVDPNGATRDGRVIINADHLANELWFDPTPNNRYDEAMPANRTDAYTVMLHELGHILGFNGWRDRTTGELPGNYQSTFDRHVTIDDSGTLFFNGPAAMAEYGNRPVPLTYSNISHFGNDTFGTFNNKGLGRPGSDLLDDLMNGVVFYRGRRYDISPLDVAVMQDVGLPAVIPVNERPTISDFTNLTINEDDFIEVPFIVSDPYSSPNNLTITATSNNGTLLPPGSLIVSGSGGNRKLRISPAANQNGSAAVTVSVSDDSLTSNGTFQLTVAPRNDAPTISAIADLVLSEDDKTSVLFTIGDLEQTLSELSISVTSNNQKLLSIPSLFLSSAGATHSLSVEPAANASGTALVTITVGDGALATIETFQVSINAVNDPPTIDTRSDYAFIFRNGEAHIRLEARDVETPLEQLMVSVESSNHALISPGKFRFGGLGIDRFVTIVPEPDEEGFATLTLRVNDGQIETTRAVSIRVSTDPYPWTNKELQLDVDGDSFVSAIDAVMIINLLNSNASGPLPWREPSTAAAPYYDVWPDNFLAPNDAVLVINYLNALRWPSPSALAVTTNSESKEGRHTALAQAVEAEYEAHGAVRAPLSRLTEDRYCAFLDESHAPSDMPRRKTRQAAELQSTTTLPKPRTTEMFEAGYTSGPLDDIFGRHSATSLARNL